MQLHWHTEPFLLISLLAACWAFTLFTGPYFFKWSGQADGTYPLLKKVSFYGSVLILYLAVGSPLDQLAEDYLFFAHMIQHMLLIYVVPLFLYASLSKELTEYLFQGKGTQRIARLLGHPVFAGFVFIAVYTIWHIPLLYEAALHDKWIHVLEHGTMLITAIWMWWPFLSPCKKYLRASSYGVRILYAFLLMVGQLPVFAFLSFANVAIYETYVWAPRIIPGLDPLNDQILGGIIMKVTNMGVSLTIISWCFYKWSSKEQPEMP
ncbi:MAG: cytochrome c oxidase assembly protein [Opitutales bacterium]|nr:cytochrome c oxidase assembly protein [Opitutales bacterium]